MILVLLYTLGGLYLVLMAAGLFHKNFVNNMGFHRRLGLLILGGGFFILGLNLTYFYFFQVTESYEAPDRYKRRYGNTNLEEARPKPGE